MRDGIGWRCRELCSLVGVVKFVCTTVSCHMDAAVRKACVLQLSTPALADACLTVHNLMRNPAYALRGGTSQAEIDLLSAIARDMVPTTSDWFMRTIEAQVIHMMASWPRCQNEVRRAWSCEGAWPAAVHATTVALLPCKLRD